MNLKTILFSVKKHLPWIIMVLTLISLWLIDTYAGNFPIQRMVHWIESGPAGEGMIVVVVATSGLILYRLKQFRAVRLTSWQLPSIQVKVTSGSTVLIQLVEKKYPGESYWSGTQEADGESHRVVICQKVGSAFVSDKQVTRSLSVASSAQFVAEQFNDLVRQHKIPLSSAEITTP
jgi:hypothetical protein